MGQSVRVFGRRMALEMLTPEEISKVSGGICYTQPDTWCGTAVGDVEETDDCGCDS